jgi:RNA polymerase sigma-70 factor (ECF subfamily)
MVYFAHQVSAETFPRELSSVASFGSERARSESHSLSELFELYYDRIAWYITSRVGNRDTAEDMAGDVFVRAVESYGGYKDRGLPVQAWLFRIAHNLVIDHYSRSAKRKSAPLDEAGEISGGSDPFGEVDLKLSMERVAEVMKLLNAGQQEVISSRLIGGMTAEEAGNIMGRTPGAIRELQRTALKALRGHLGPDITHLGASQPERHESDHEREGRRWRLDVH